MSSPRKRIKLTPKKNSSTPTPRHTQESKVTSTPQRLVASIRGSTASPNLSEISSIRSSANIRTNLTDVSDVESSPIDKSSISNDESNQLSLRSSSPYSFVSSDKNILEVEDYDAFINRHKKLKYTGKTWKLYRPLHENSLYALILQNPQNIQEIVTEWLVLYNRKPEKAIHKLLKLCVDVCGFQNFNIADYFNFEPEIPKRIIEMMESAHIIEQQEVLINTGKYLFMEQKSVLMKVVKAAIYSFLHKLIFASHDRNVLYDGFFALHFFLFVKCLAFSHVRAIRHTGVVFGIKILSALVMVYNRIVNEDNSSNSLSSDELKKQEISSYIDLMYFIFVKNCRIQENKVVLMRVECVYEEGIWIKYFPKIFITELQTAVFLLKLMSDALKEVRFAVLEVFEALIGSSEVLKFLKRSVPEFVEHIGKRFYDIDIKISVKAIDIYITIYNNDENLITTKRFKILMNLVFDKYFPIGEAACRFLINYLEKSESSQETVLLQLAKFSMKPGDAIKQLLVEGCLNNCSAIQNWRLYLHIFMNDDVELNIKEHLAALFSEAVYQVLIGRSSIMREKSPKVAIVDPALHTKVAKQLPVFFSLLEKYKDDSIILMDFLKIFLCIKDAVINDIPLETIKDICFALEQLFYYQGDESLLKKICEAIHCFTVIPNHANTAKNVALKIVSKYTNDFMGDVINMNEETNVVVLKVAVLFEKFNLSDKLKWESIFDSWSETHEVITGNLMSCCKWYLIWSLKNLSNVDGSSPEFPRLIRNCREFISTSFNALQHLKGQSLHFKTYECLCDLHIAYMQHLEELTKTAKQMEKFKLVIDNKELQQVLISFLENYVISNTAMTLSERRHYVVKYIDLVHINVLPVECLANIFKYYHMYNKEYGPMIEFSLSGMIESDTNAFLMIIVYTLTICYEKILEKYNVVDMSTQEVRDLKLLIKQFLNLKQFKSPNKNVTKLIYFVINYSLNNTSRYPFLFFAKYFVDILVDIDSKKEVINFFKEKLPKEAEKDDAVLFLVNYLKNRKLEKSLKKPAVNVSSKENKPVSKARQKVDKTSKKGRPKEGVKKVEDKQIKKATEIKRRINVDSETEVSEDDLTIHDSESDDFDESFKPLRV